jgi:mRNA interferase RelE/StbE
MWRIEFTNIARKSLANMPLPDARRIERAIGDMAEDPLAGDVKRLTDQAAFRKRVGDWRIIFRLERATILVTIIDVRRRNERTYR